MTIEAFPETRKKHLEDKYIASYKILQHYRHIELIKKGSVVTGIKPIDHSEEWEKFTHSILEWREQLPTANIDSTLATFLTAADNQEMAFKELITFCNNYNEKDNIHRKELGREILRYIGTVYADATNLRIANYVQYQGLSISEQFLRSFLSLMNSRLHLIRKAIKELRNRAQLTIKSPDYPTAPTEKPSKSSFAYRAAHLSGNDIAPLTFEGLFTDPSYVEPSLEILRNLGATDQSNNYIDKSYSKGLWPMWQRTLSRSHNGIQIMKGGHSRQTYRDLFVTKFKNLCLSRDGSEWKNEYKDRDGKLEDARVNIVNAIALLANNNPKNPLPSLPKKEDWEYKQ